MTQVNLGRALSILGAREGGTARLEESVAAYNKALHVYVDARSKVDELVAKANFEIVEALISERHNENARE